jgi:hypothetical protein
VPQIEEWGKSNFWEFFRIESRSIGTGAVRRAVGPSVTLGSIMNIPSTLVPFLHGVRTPFGTGAGVTDQGEQRPNAAFVDRINRLDNVLISAFAPFVLGSLAAKYNLATGIALCTVGYIIAILMALFLPETKT